MPPEVFLVLAGSGLSLVASMLFLVSDEAPPEDRPGAQLAFCLPPARLPPPPLPAPLDCAVPIALGAVVTLKPVGEEWVVTLDVAPLRDVPALRVSADGRELGGQVHDLRWDGRAGVARATRRVWKQKPGRA